MLCSTCIRLASEIKTNAWLLWRFANRENRVLAFSLTLITPLSFKGKRKSPTKVCSEEHVRIQSWLFLPLPDSPNPAKLVPKLHPKLHPYGAMYHWGRFGWQKLNRIIFLLVQSKGQTYTVSSMYLQPNFVKDTHNKLLLNSRVGEYQWIYGVCVNIFILCIHNLFLIWLSTCIISIEWVIKITLQILPASCWIFFPDI